LFWGVLIRQYVYLLRAIFFVRHLVLSITLIGWSLWYPAFLTLGMFVTGLAMLLLPRETVLSLSNVTTAYVTMLFLVNYIYCLVPPDVEVRNIFQAQWLQTEPRTLGFQDG
jgi:hypothetical protein